MGRRERNATPREGSNRAEKVAAQRARAATRQYAKRQLTWFRNQTPDWARRT